MIDTIYGFGNGLFAAPWWTGAGWPVIWTLIKIMAGVVAADEGRMKLDGREVTFASPAAANASRQLRPSPLISWWRSS